MKYLILGILFATHISFAADDHPNHHVKHNFIMVGVNEVHASHLVYKVPHNFQVILKLHLSPEVQEQYETLRKQYPQDLFIIFFDAFTLADLDKKQDLSATILREDKEGNRINLITNVRLAGAQYEVLFFNELPLILSKN